MAGPSTASARLPLHAHMGQALRHVRLAGIIWLLHTCRTCLHGLRSQRACRNVMYEPRHQPTNLGTQGARIRFIIMKGGQGHRAAVNRMNATGNRWLDGACPSEPYTTTDLRTRASRRARRMGALMQPLSQCMNAIAVCNARAGQILTAPPDAIIYYYARARRTHAAKKEARSPKCKSRNNVRRTATLLAFRAWLLGANTHAWCRKGGKGAKSHNAVHAHGPWGMGSARVIVSAVGGLHMTCDACGTLDSIWHSDSLTRPTTDCTVFGSSFCASVLGPCIYWHHAGTA